MPEVTSDSLIELTRAAQSAGLGSEIRADRAQPYADALQNVLVSAGITTALRLRHFIAQVAHETASFGSLVESTNYTDPTRLLALFKSNVKTLVQAQQLVAARAEAIGNCIYANRLGNGDEASGDGYRYRGRGFLMITGKSNYAEVQSYSGLPVLAQPTLLGQPSTAAQAAGQFWATRNINAFADRNDADGVTLLVNGAAKEGLAKRIQWLGLAETIWPDPVGAPAPAPPAKAAPAAQPPSPPAAPLAPYPGRVIQAGEGDADVVKTIADRLRALGYTPSSQGVFDDDLASSVALFQSQHTDSAGRALTADGKIGPLTWHALFGAPATVDSPDAAGLAGAALARAITQIGQMETPGHPNSGPMVDVYLKSVFCDPGANWCMAFVNWCFQHGAADINEPDAFPKTAGCLDAWNKVSAQAPNRLVTAAEAIADPSRVKPGFVFILDHGGGNGHTGFVRSTIGAALQTVEGNSNDNGSANGVGVFNLNRRSVTDAALKGFLDFTS